MREAPSGEPNLHALLTSENLANLPSRASDGPQKPESVGSDQTVADERDETTGHPKNFGQMNMDQSTAPPTMAKLLSMTCPRCKSDLLVKFPGSADWIVPDSVYETRQAATCQCLYPSHPSTDPANIFEWLRDIRSDPFPSIGTTGFPPLTCTAFCAIFRQLQLARSSTSVLELGQHQGHKIPISEYRRVRQYWYALEFHFRKMVLRLMGNLGFVDIPENYLRHRTFHISQSNEEELWNDLGDPIDHTSQLDESEPGVFFFVRKNPGPREITMEDVEPDESPRSSIDRTSQSDEEGPEDSSGNTQDNMITHESDEEGPENGLGYPEDNMSTHQSDEDEPWKRFADPNDFMIRGQIPPENYIETPIVFPERRPEEEQEEYFGSPEEEQEEYLADLEEEQEEYLGDPEEELGSSIENPVDLTISGDDSDEDEPQEFVGNWRVLEPTPEGEVPKNKHATGGKVRCSF